MENPFLKRAVFLLCASTLADILLRLSLPQGNSSFGQTFPIEKTGNKQISPITFKEASHEYGGKEETYDFPPQADTNLETFKMEHRYHVDLTGFCKDSG